MRSVVAIVLVLASGVGRAEPPKSKTRGSCKQTPGSCCPDPATPRVRVCYATPLGGAFDARAKYPDTLLLVFEGERPTRTLDPPTDAFDVKSRGNSVAITPLKEGVEGNIQILTAHQRFTITLRPSREPDAQLHLRDPEKDSRDAVIEHRVEEAVAAKRKELEDAQRARDQRAGERAEEVLVAEIARSGIEVREVRGKPTRSQGVVLRPTNFARVGDRRFLLFAIENHSGKTFHLKAVHLAADEREQTVKPRIARQELPADIGDEQQVTGVIPLPHIRSGARLRLTIEESDPQRNVSITAEAP
jgi:hypothetical protein